MRDFLSPLVTPSFLYLYTLAALAQRGFIRTSRNGPKWAEMGRISLSWTDPEQLSLMNTLWSNPFPLIPYSNRTVLRYIPVAVKYQRDFHVAHFPI